MCVHVCVHAYVRSCTWLPFLYFPTCLYFCFLSCVQAAGGPSTEIRQTQDLGYSRTVGQNKLASLIGYQVSSFRLQQQKTNQDHLQCNSIEKWATEGMAVRSPPSQGS